MLVVLVALVVLVVCVVCVVFVVSVVVVVAVVFVVFVVFVCLFWDPSADWPTEQIWRGPGPGLTGTPHRPIRHGLADGVRPARARSRTDWDPPSANPAWIGRRGQAGAGPISD